MCILIRAVDRNGVIEWALWEKKSTLRRYVGLYIWNEEFGHQTSTTPSPDLDWRVHRRKILQNHKIESTCETPMCSHCSA